MNHWYFCSLGLKAFTLEGGVPYRFPSSALIQKADARSLYWRVADGELGQGGEQVVVKRWGSGGLFEPALVFLDEIKQLDEQHRTHVYSRVIYVISDISVKAIEESHANAKKHPGAQGHVDAGILQFEVHDAKKISSIRSHVITSSYLYDSISQPIIAKVDGAFYELQYRGYIDENGKYFQTRDRKEITPLEFKRWLERNDLEKLSNVSPYCFRNIRWEAKLVRIADMTQYPNGLFLENMTQDADNFTLPTGQTSVESLQNAADSLAPNGYVQTFDFGLTSKDDLILTSGTIGRSNGAVYKSVNFCIIERVLKARGFHVEIEAITDYLERTLGEKVLPMRALDDCAAVGNERRFSKYFPFELMRNSRWMRETANRIQAREGYSENGRDLFCRELKAAGLLQWTDKILLTTRRKGKPDYIVDLRKTLISYIRDYPFSTLPEQWMHQNSPNDCLIKRLETFGYDESLVGHLFRHHQEISKNFHYFHLCTVHK
jgi:hypothetical protein